MASRRKILRSWIDVALIEENIYVLLPFLNIETVYVVISKRRIESSHFNNLDGAMQEFEAEIARSAGATHIDRFYFVNLPLLPSAVGVAALVFDSTTIAPRAPSPP